MIIFFKLTKVILIIQRFFIIYSLILIWVDIKIFTLKYYICVDNYAVFFILLGAVGWTAPLSAPGTRSIQSIVSSCRTKKIYGHSLTIPAFHCVWLSPPFAYPVHLPASWPSVVYYLQLTLSDCASEHRPHFYDGMPECDSDASAMKRQRWSLCHDLSSSTFLFPNAILTCALSTFLKKETQTL